jgi:hypothetical protein
VINAIGHNRGTAQGTTPRRLGLLGFFGLSLAITGLLVLSAWREATTLGAPGYWTWLLTGLQVFALWGAGTKQRWGWLLGAAVQPPWIAYALLTGQLGFIPGCVISGVVQTYSFLRGQARSSLGFGNFRARDNRGCEVTSQVQQQPAEVTV